MTQTEITEFSNRLYSTFREYTLGIMNYQNALQKESVLNRHIIKSQ